MGLTGILNLVPLHLQKTGFHNRVPYEHHTRALQVFRWGINQNIFILFCLCGVGGSIWPILCCGVSLRALSELIWRDSGSNWTLKYDRNSSVYFIHMATTYLTIRACTLTVTISSIMMRLITNSQHDNRWAWFPTLVHILIGTGPLTKQCKTLSSYTRSKLSRYSMYIGYKNLMGTYPRLVSVICSGSKCTENWISSFTTIPLGLAS